MNPRDAKKTGFTLVEIVVVIAIASLLSALLFTVFSRVREVGRRTVCQSNLKQIALAVHQYSVDNGGLYPLRTFYGPGYDIRFDEYTEPLKYYSDPNGTHGWAKRIQPYINNTDIFHCPDWRSSPSSTVIGTYSDYAYNTNLAGVPESQFTHPANTILSFDFETNWGGDFWISQPSVRHSGHSNYVFTDGHVKWLKAEQTSLGHMALCQSPLIHNFTCCYR